MGTRADFYIGRGENAEWLGSTAWDGYPNGIDITTDEMDKWSKKHAKFPTGQHLFDSTTEEEFRQRLAQYFDRREDVTPPERGWPWPWEDSATTDYAYAFDDGKVYASCFGSAWFDPHSEPEEHSKESKARFPNMKGRQNVTFGPRSGLIVLGG